MKYQINVSRNEKVLCKIEIVQLRDQEAALNDILERFPENEGFISEVLVAHDEKRLLEVSSEGIKVLSCTPNFKVLEQP